MKRAFLFLLASVSLISCSNRYVTAHQFPYHDDGTTKPKVAIAPVFDHSNSHMDWDLSKEFTQTMTEKLIQTGYFYLTSDFEMLTAARISALGINPFCDDLSWVSEMHSSSEFLIFAEIVKHNLIKRDSSFTPLNMVGVCDLELTLRIKVVDIRSREPKVILQEIFEETYAIPWKMGHGTEEKGAFKHSAFQFSPMGTAHNHLLKKVTVQIKDYIQFVKARH